MKIHKNKVLEIFLFIVSIIYLIIFCHPLIISSDETFTLSLIHHTFPKLLYLDSLDVHPPLYYILLKIFIDGLTFWTNSVVIKVLTARLFSILATIIMFMYLTKYIGLLGIKINRIILWIMFLLLPNVLGIRFLFQQMTNIRMYALAALFTTMTLYYLLKFHRNGSLINWCLFTLSSIAAAYTHYYAALFVGLLILISLIDLIHIHADKSHINNLSISLLILIVSYVPWIKVFYGQIINTHTYWMNYHIMLRDVVIYLILFGIFAYPLYKYSQQNTHRLFKQQIIEIVTALSIVFILTVSLSILNKPIFLSRYFYPLLIVYEFLGLCVTYQLFKSKSFLKINVMIIIFMLLISGVSSAIYQIEYFNRQNIKSEEVETHANIQHSPVKIRCNNKLDLLQGYVYILYKGQHRHFHLMSNHIRYPILKTHQQTYSNITKYIYRN